MNNGHDFELHPLFPSGEWEGFYTYSTGHGRQEQMEIVLNFTNGIITGGGADPVGSFEWTGNYDTRQETCTIIKQYHGEHSVYYTGFADENGIWGKWNIHISSTGHFHIWPKKKNDNEQQLAEQAEEEIVPIQVAAYA